MGAHNLEDGDIRAEGPKSTSEDARVLVPLHSPGICREAVAEEQPGEGHHICRGVCPLRSNPYRDEKGICQGTRRALRGVVIGHDGTEVVEGAHYACGDGAVVGCVCGRVRVLVEGLTVCKNLSLIFNLLNRDGFTELSHFNCRLIFI